MKKNVRIVVMAVLVAIGMQPSLFASETSVAWEQIYSTAINDTQRAEIMQKIIDFHSNDFVPLLGDALQGLLQRKIESGDPTEVKTKTSLAILIIGELGNLKAIDNADLIYSVYKDVKDPFIKGESVLALGKMRAIAYAELLSRDLLDINLKPNLSNPRPQEIVAYALVQCFSLMKAPISYKAVFFASTGWYSAISKVKETARDTLSSLSDDPTSALIEIIKTETLTERRIAALNAAADSKAPNEGKAQVARTSLELGLAATSNDVMQKQLTVNLRIGALRLLAKLLDKSPDSVPAASGCIDRDESDDEVLLAYAYLGLNGSDAACNYLIQKMRRYNEAMKNGLIKDRDRMIVRQLIPSMGATKNAKCKLVLSESEFAGWDGQVIRDLRQAEAQIP